MTAKMKLTKKVETENAVKLFFYGSGGDLKLETDTKTAKEFSVGVVYEIEVFQV